MAYATLGEASIPDSAFREVAKTLTTAKAVRLALSDPLKARHAIEAELARGREMAALDRPVLIRELVNEFGLDACVRALSHAGHAPPGVEMPERVRLLGEEASIRCDGQEIYRARPHLVRQIFDVLALIEPVSETTRHDVARLIGMGESGGHLSLHREDGLQVEDTWVASWQPEAALTPGP
jgi:hypothetical protein